MSTFAAVEARQQRDNGGEDKEHIDEEEEELEQAVTLEEAEAEVEEEAAAEKENPECLFEFLSTSFFTNRGAGT